MLSSALLLAFVLGHVVSALPQGPSSGFCADGTQPSVGDLYTEDFNGFTAPTRTICTEPGTSFSYRLDYDNFVNVDGSELDPPVPNSAADPSLPDILLASTPLTQGTDGSHVPAIVAYDEEQFDLKSLEFQCRSFCSNEKDPDKCNAAAVPMACKFTITCQPSATGAKAVTKSVQSTAKDAKGNFLKTVSFDDSFSALAKCELAAETDQKTLYAVLTKILTLILKVPILNLSITLQVYVANFIKESKTGVALLIDNVQTQITKCIDPSKFVR